MELNFSKTKVLLVDDDENYGFALKTLLGSKGLNINSYTNPEEALEFLKREKVDIILLDYYMPQMTGEEFLRNLREFDKTTIVFLQTAFSEEKPQLEMLETLNIQGYIDKNKEPNDIFLDIASGIKMAELVNVIQEKDRQIDAQSCRNEFLGKFLNRLMGEIGERSMAMVGSVTHLDEMENDIPEVQKEVFVNSVNTLKNSTTKLNELIKSIEVSQDVITVGELERKLGNLFDITFAVKDVKLNIKYDDQYTMLDCNQEIILHILVDIIEELVNKDEKEINILVEKNDKVIVKVCNNLTNIDFLDKLNKLAYLDEKINIVTEFEQLAIAIG